MPLTTVNWADGSKFMQVEIDLGSGFVDIGTQQMLSVPYALNAEIAGNGFSHIGPFGDTLYFNNGSFLIVPGIGAANTEANSPYGCTDTQACNYSSVAIVDNNTCQYVGGFCNDGDASTINDSWTLDCTCEGIITAPGATHYCGAQNVHNPEISYGTMTDQDGNLYKTVIIGSQEWMAENLRVKHYRTGVEIQEGNLTTWSNVNNTTGRWINYNNDVDYECPYGLLYNRFVVTNNPSVCPLGWHVPSDGEWTTLVNFLNTNATASDAGGKMKSAGTFFWSGTNTAGTNSSGFSALPGGYLSATANFSGLGIFGYYWSNTATGAGTTYNRIFGNSTSSATRSSSEYNAGHSVRCLRD
jgi:uncharacterized protein (TIGR02145 family)